MKTATFDHSVKVLLKAYLNDTLEHDNCHACAVGNLIADAHGCGYRIPVGSKRNGWDIPMTSMWDTVFATCNKRQIRDVTNYTGEARRQIDSTGYSAYDLARIEFAFESADHGNSDDDYMFNGLMAVLDVLAEIHNIDLVTVKETKELFV